MTANDFARGQSLNVGTRDAEKPTRAKADGFNQTALPSFLKPVVGPGWSDAAQAYVENADERPRRLTAGPSGRGWWFEQMAKACPGLKNNYCVRCGTLLKDGACPKGCR